MLPPAPQALGIGCPGVSFKRRGDGFANVYAPPGAANRTVMGRGYMKTRVPFERLNGLAVKPGACSLNDSEVKRCG